MNNLELMRLRLEKQGGVKQEDRMIKDKYRTFLKTLKYSYQGCDVQLAQHWYDCGDEVDEPRFRALINPDKTKQDYDDKILSIGYDSGYGPGDVFHWTNTDTYWIIYLQQLTEDAYFRGEIRQCRWKIKFKDKSGEWLDTWAAIRGPVETQINSIQKNQDRVDTPNLSLDILLPCNEKTMAAFDRYQEFLLAGRCWRVEAPDIISMKNVIEIHAEEYYIDHDTDDVEQEMKNGLILEKVEPKSDIEGETFVRPQFEYRFTAPEPGGTWKVREKDLPVSLVAIDGQTIAATWQAMKSGQYTLMWQKQDGNCFTKTVVVESLF